MTQKKHKTVCLAKDMCFYLDKPAKGFNEVLREDALKRRKKFNKKFKSIKDFFKSKKK
tara:strand:+ start:480 stop:653 length:174 start_codon:yes stop_codon:yes gene_type:complete